MSGYILVMGPCFGCKRVFSYNPVHVPSIRINGVRQPICLACVHQCNPARIRNGLRPIIPHRDAYEPAPEEEVPC